MQALINLVEFPTPALEAIHSSMKGIEVLMGSAIQPLLGSVADALQAIVLTMHNEDFSRWVHYVTAILVIMRTSQGVCIMSLITLARTNDDFSWWLYYVTDILFIIMRTSQGGRMHYVTTPDFLAPGAVHNFTAHCSP